MFNVLNSRGLVVDAVVLDAFCGTGALGLEALSQGAGFASFFDKAKSSVELCKKNIELLKEEEQSQVAVMDATQIKPLFDNISPATLVFLDPPYNLDFVPKALESLLDKDWMAPDASIVIETSKNEIVSCPHINVELEKLYGDTKIILGTLK